MSYNLFLDKIKPYNRKIGYNFYPTACYPLGTKHSIESRKRMSESHIGNKHTEESRRKIS